MLDRSDSRWRIGCGLHVSGRIDDVSGGRSVNLSLKRIQRICTCVTGCVGFSWSNSLGEGFDFRTMENASRSDSHWFSKFINSIADNSIPVRIDIVGGVLQRDWIVICEDLSAGNCS